MEPLSVERKHCRRIGRFLAGLGFKLPEKELELKELPDPDVRMFYFVVVAICHQTTPIGKPRLEGMINGQFRYGWDYLRECWLGAAKADPYILTPSWLMFCQASDIVYILYDNHRHCGAHITDPEGRARLLRDIGFRMYCDRAEHVDEYYNTSGGWLSGSKDYRPGSNDSQFGLESLLKRFEAYGKDPVKKKLTFFLMLMKRYGFWNYHDIEKLGAPVDYHEMRLHLRLGTVTFSDQQLLAKIKSGQVLTSEEDVSIRKAVYEAIFEISRASGRIPADLHNLFWHMSRNCCRRDETHCLKCGSHGAMPERYELLLSDKRCIFSDNCASATLPHYEKPKEPAVDTDLY